MKTLRDFLNETKLASNVNTDMKNSIPFIHDRQIGWIGGWRGLRDPSKEFAIMPPFSKKETYDDLGDYDNYPVKSGEALARLGSDMTNKSGTSNASIVKLNLEKGTIAFLVDYEADQSEVKWERGIKFRFLQISQSGIRSLKKH